ncbi:MAG TPA: DNA-binding protein [Nitrososphaera sp.]|nr:DNA-binding protein [Nitrososphaera sp.]
MTFKEEDLDIEIIKARKLKEMRERVAALERAKNVSQSTTKRRTAREVISEHLYDRGDEVLDLAYAQYPVQTEAIISRIAELIQAGEITSKISGGELLALLRSVGLNIRLKTNIKIEDKGKLISFSDKLKQQKYE